jgi:hypothetical protein
MAKNGSIWKKQAQQILQKKSGKEVGSAFKSLQKDGFIYSLGRQPFSGRRGVQPESYFLTVTGLRALMEISPEADLLWSALIEMSHPGGISRDAINQIVTEYTDMHTMYEGGFLYFVYSDKIDSIMLDWDRHLGKNAFLAKKVLAELANERRLTLRVLAQKCAVSTGQLERVLHPLSAPNTAFSRGKLGISAAGSIDFLLSKSIKAVENPLEKYSYKNTRHNDISKAGNIRKGKEQRIGGTSFLYELSTLGILEFIYHSANLKPAQETTNPSAVDVNNELVEVFRSRMRLIAQNYPDKLPLIFGKSKSQLWKETEPFHPVAFSRILHKKSRDSAFRFTTMLGGTMEYTEDAKNMALWNHRRLEYFIQSGFNALNYKRTKPRLYHSKPADDDPNFGTEALEKELHYDRTSPIHAKLLELCALYGERTFFQNPKDDRAPSLEMVRRYQKHVSDVFEKSIAEGFSFLYYLSILSEIMPYESYNYESLMSSYSEPEASGLEDDDGMDKDEMSVTQHDSEGRDDDKFGIPARTILKKAIISDPEISGLIGRWFSLIIAYRSRLTKIMEKRAIPFMDNKNAIKTM